MGIYTDGVGTTELAGSLRLDRPLNPQLAEALTSGVAFSYRNFVELVAAGRNMTAEQVDAVAQGRIWSAPDALEHGLVDGLGSLQDAVAAAAALADLDSYEVEYAQPHLSPRELFLQQLAERTGALGMQAATGINSVLAAWLAPVTDAAAELASLRDPRHLYARCLECALVR